MQKALFTVFLVALLPIAGLAQITLDESDFIMEPDYVDARVLVFSDPPIPVPQHGEDRVYDYSDLFSSVIDSTFFHEATDENFESATRFHVGSPALGPISLQSEYYKGINESGLFRAGSYLLPQRESLGPLTGNPEDSIIFPGSYSVFEEPEYAINFPATYGDEWSSEAKFVTDAQVTAAAFFLNNAEVTNQQSFTREGAVVGWGELILPGKDDTEVSFEVLLIRDRLDVLDSTFLEGEPAPPQLLSAFNLVQGQQSFTNAYYFYAPGFSTPLLRLVMNPDWDFVNSATFKSDLVISNTEDIVTNKVDATAFPNPVGLSERVIFQTSEPMTDPVLTVFDNSGRILFSGSPDIQAEDTFSWEPNNMPGAGLLYYQIKDQNSANYTSGKLLIK
ncbi:MAG: hypothetical protein EA411_12275 [Saprospirales bacterium]|nr:MAG: hypothetical protein EA411_12275 [Saprospirales bacterium]